MTVPADSERLEGGERGLLFSYGRFAGSRKGVPRVRLFLEVLPRELTEKAEYCVGSVLIIEFSSRLLN